MVPLAGKAGLSNINDLGGDLSRDALIEASTEFSPPVPPPLPATYRESSDLYPRVVAVLNDRWRVIACPAGIQWILQCRGRSKTMATSRWRGRSYCRTSEALIRCCREYAGEIEPAARAILAALPPRIEGGAA